MLDTAVADQTQSFLDGFGAALETGDVDAALGMFQDDCYWRDLVSFTWNLKTLEGKDQVAEMLRHQLATAKPTGWKVASGETPTEDGGITTAWIEFETEVGRGYGLVRLKDGLI
ncbi:MAG: nuclear transport factor 2 family protein, partial [Pseudomonadota bacterium]